MLNWTHGPTFTYLQSIPVFLNLFWFTAPILRKNLWRHPYIGKLLLQGTLEANYW